MTISIEMRTTITNLDEQVSRARSTFDRWTMTEDEWDEPSWLIEICYLQLLVALEALTLSELRNIVYAEYMDVKGSEDGFSKTKLDPEGSEYSPILARIRRYIMALRVLLPMDEQTTVTKDILDIIRNSHYIITDRAVFSAVPQSESDVHHRIEAILKCVFPDLKHKPTLTKQIKNFEPDTGIPSLKTLIEYKFLSRKEDVGVIADQVLADTRGYTSKDWVRFLYVIYETNRFRTESDWNQLMRDSGVPISTIVVVLGGEPPGEMRSKKKK